MFWRDPFLRAPVRRYGPAPRPSAPPAWAWALMWFLTGAVAARVISGLFGF